MTTTPKLLIVDDDVNILALIKAHLEADGYQILLARDGDEALSTIKRENPDLLLLDIMMPSVDGLTVCAQVREYSEVPIIMVSALGHEDQKVKALDLGADDYLTKPYGKEELKARVRAALRRAYVERKTKPKAVYQHGDFQIDFLRRQVSVDGQVIKLTPTEYGLLRELSKDPGNLVSHEQLLRQVWGPEYLDSVHYLHIHMSKLRKKLSVAAGIRIETHSGVGYILSTSE
jgi:two-component system KDP operon response regulator KdpE